MSDLAGTDFSKLPKPFSSTIAVDVFGMSDPGHVRKNNEDHYIVIRANRVLETVLSNLATSPQPDRFEETGYGFVVADGVGGQASGEVASREAIFGLLNLALETPDWQFRWGPKEMNTVKWRIKDRFQRVNAELVHQATVVDGHYGMSTTMTAALSHGKDLIIGHIGDSRAYLFRKGKLKRLTRDHTLAETLIDRGSDPNNHLFSGLRNVLVQALGARDTGCAPDIDAFGLEDGDQLLLCTDGLTGMVEETEIESVLLTEDSAQSACRGLIELALVNGGRDNITVIVARYSIPES